MYELGAHVIMSLGHETFLADAARLELTDAKHEVSIFAGNRVLENLVMDRVACRNKRIERRRVKIIAAHIRGAADKLVSRILHYPR